MDEDDKPSENEKSWFGETIKDLTSAGLATIFMTEESVRNYLREKKLPKEMVGLVAEAGASLAIDDYGT